MKFFDRLILEAGLANRRREVLVISIGFSLGLCVFIFAQTNVLGLGICFGILVQAAALEFLRLRAQARVRQLDASWPQVFEAIESGLQSQMQLLDQFRYLALSGPPAHRPIFRQALVNLERGHELQLVLSQLRQAFSSRGGDLLALLLELEAELGGVGLEKTFSQAAQSQRRELADLGQLLAKQGWVALSAKLALLAPWLVSLVLIQLPQNKAAFATELGSLVLFSGLALSLFAYALVNKLGHLPLPQRVLNGS